MSTFNVYHWCAMCDRDTGSARDPYCPGCLGHLENQLEPITRWPATPPRPGRWARVWRWLETRPDWIADLGSDD